MRNLRLVGGVGVAMTMATAGCFTVTPSSDPPQLDPTATMGGTPDDSGGTTMGDDSATGIVDDGPEDTSGTPPDDTGPVVDDTAGDTTSAESTDDGSTGADITATIYEIQDGTIPEGDDAEVLGVVVTAVTSDGFFAQELPGGIHSGLFVFTGAGVTVARGDEVDLVGTVVEVDQMTTLDTTSGGVTPTGVSGIELAAEMVAEADLSPPMGEDWEGVLVRVDGAPLGVSAVLPTYFTVSDTGSANVGGLLYDAAADAGQHPGFGVGASFSSIAGIQYHTLMGFRLSPRDALDLEGYQPPLAPDTHNFPSPGDASMVMFGTLPWNGGDYYEGFRSTTVPSISSLEINIDIVSNGLSACGFQTADVIVNGTTVGQFTISQGTVAIDEVYAIAPAIAGPDYTIRYQTVATVESGCGAAGYSDTTSTVTFNP